MHVFIYDFCMGFLKAIAVFIVLSILACALLWCIDKTAEQLQEKPAIYLTEPGGPHV